MLHDLRFAVRSLSRRPGATLVVVLILGLGMGATTAVIDLTNLLVWRQVPVERSEELVKVFTASHRGFTGPYGFISYPDYVDYRDASRSVAGLAAHLDLELRIDTGVMTEYASVALVSGNFFEVLRLKTARGRSLSVGDDRPGAAPVAVIAHHLWRRLGADERILGTSLSVEGQAFTVVGVGPPGFTSTTAGTVTDVFLPVASLPAVDTDGEGVLESRQRARFAVIGRLGPGESRAGAQAELAALAQRLDREHPLADHEKRQISTTAANITHPVDLERMAPTLRLFGAAVALLLIITCANVAHLLLARSAARRREMAVRQSIGASRGVLVRQLLTENFLLALGGGLCGLVLAAWARAFLRAFAGAEYAGELRFDVRVLGMSFLVCLAATLLFGLAPALTALRVNLTAALKGDESDGRRRLSAGELLAAAQVGLCVVLLVAAVLLAQSLRNRLDADLGFEIEGMIVAEVDLPDTDYPREQGVVFFHQLQERAEALAGVERTGMAMIVPPILYDVSVPFRLPEDLETTRRSRLNIVDSAYFSTLGLTVEQGRVFDLADASSENAVVVVNRQLAEQLWPGENPLGRTIRLDATRPDSPGPDHTVIGVVSSVSQHRSSHGGEPIFYFSSGQRYRSRQQLILRSAAPPAVVFEALRGLLREMDPRLALSQTRTGEANLLEAFTFERMQARAVGIFAGLGFVLAVVGIFGVLSYAVSRRVREIGIRMALGARRRDVRRQVVRRGMGMALAGASVGLAATVLASRLLESLLFGVAAGDVRVLAAVLLSILAAAGVAAYLPARRASLLDPLRALRHE